MVLEWVLATQCVLLVIVGWQMLRANRTPSSERAQDVRNQAGPIDGKKVRDLLTTAGKVLAEHAMGLDGFQRSLDEQGAAGRREDSSALKQEVERIRRSNRQVEETVDETVAELTAACGELLQDEQSHLETYQEKTGTFDRTLEAVNRETLLAGIAGKLLDMVQELRLENKTVRDEISAAKDRSIELLARVRTAEHDARIDSLTRLPNRRAFEEAHAECSAVLDEKGEVYSLVLMDIDHFKALNDQFGHTAGDSVLRMLGQVMRDTCRMGHCVCRLGGEEFAVLLPGAVECDALRVAEGYRKRIGSARLRYRDDQLSVTVSCGIAQAAAGQSSGRVMERADAALYAAKMRGRDRTCVDQLLHTVS